MSKKRCGKNLLYIWLVKYLAGRWPRHAVSQERCVVAGCGGPDGVIEYEVGTYVMDMFGTCAPHHRQWGWCWLFVLRGNPSRSPDSAPIPLPGWN